MIDRDNNRALVSEPDLSAVIAVDLTSGARTILSNSSTPDAVNAFSSPSGVELDRENKRALVSDDGIRGLIAVDLVNGQRVFVSR